MIAGGRKGRIEGCRKKDGNVGREIGGEERKRLRQGEGSMKGRITGKGSGKGVMVVIRKGRKAE